MIPKKLKNVKGQNITQKAKSKKGVGGQTITDRQMFRVKKEAPDVAKRLAITAPIPVPSPVTNATLFLSRSLISHSRIRHSLAKNRRQRPSLLSQ